MRSMVLASMTIAIASYQRREPLLRLLRGLDQQVAASEELRRDLDVVVVLDGSTDGSREAVEAEAWTVDVRVHWQPNGGLASARNVGLAAAAGRLVWFLDDDLVPSPGLVERHRRAHGGDVAGVVVGPCRIPPDADAPLALLRWWDSFYAELEAAGTIERFDRFTVANASAPAALLAAVGGFDERFVAYGLEDYELGVRLLRAETPLRFDAVAVAWHPDIPAMSVLVARQRSLGRNAARIVQMHPEIIDTVFPPTRSATRPAQVLRRLGLRSPRSLMAVSRLAFAAHSASVKVHAGVSHRAEHLARTAAHAAGVAEGDPTGTLLDRVLGAQRDGRGRGRGSSARASRQPPSSPASSDGPISR